MIQITDKHNCCGCAACVQVCPKQCIEFQEDEKGFRYPITHIENCINCGLCENVCVFLNPRFIHNPIEVYAAININEEIREKSSSGGIFTMIAELVVDNGGVVFGACYDEKWNVIHDYSETKHGIERFRGSKYVQSFIKDSYVKVLEYLKNGRQVLFSGTPCQVAGLKNFLRKRYDNLLTIEVACHGVPSPLVWRSYLEYVNPEKKEISFINLRDKSRGWKRYSYLIKAGDLTLVDEYASSSLYLLGFSLNLTLRPSCYKCPVKDFKSGADITLADCWGSQYISDINDDDKGISAVIVNSDKGNQFVDQIESNRKKLNYEFVKKYNSSICSASKEPYCSKVFWNLFKTHGIKAVGIIHDRLQNDILFRIYNKIRTYLIK